MIKTAIYARFSSDMQNPRSIEDQVELCRAHAERNGFTVVETFEDRARSGASILGRDGLLSLMDKARAREFSVVIVEALDRLSRDQEDLAGIFKRLSFADIKIDAVHDGVADTVQVGIRGLVGALYLQDLSNKVRRGMAGVTREGRHAGGRAYGYRPIAGAPGELEIVEEEAAIVRRIFEAFASGASPRVIAAGLNKEKVTPPRGGAYWAAGALWGNRKRGYGILLNPLYAGEIVWNRVRMTKDPTTGRRVSRPNDPNHWQRADAPHLSIIDRELFDRVQQLMVERSAVHPTYRRAPTHLLSGLLRCGCCGGGMSVKDVSAGRVRVRCTAAREGGACANGRSFYLDHIQGCVLSGLQGLLRNRRALSVYVARYNSARRLLVENATGRKETSEARLRQIAAEIDRTVNGMVRGLIEDADAAKILPTLRSERAVIEAELAAIGQQTNIVTLHPHAANDYLASIDKLAATLAEEEVAAARDKVRRLIDKVVVTPADGKPDIRLDGWLNALAEGNSAFPSLGGSAVALPRYHSSPQSGGLPFSLRVG